MKNFLDLLLFRGKGVLPTRRLLAIFFALAIVLFALSFINHSWSFIIFANALVLVSSLFDLLLLPKRKDLVFSRKINRDLERDLPYKVSIDVENKSDQAFLFELLDDLPESFVKKSELKGELASKESKSFTYNFRATVRGDYDLEKLHIRYRSPFGLWAKQLTVEDLDEVRVIPDLTEVKSYLHDAQKFLIYEGMKIRKQQVGMGEFASIRNYVVGDDPRTINWRQTAKLQEVMTNVYEPEHGKYITILVDCGRMMGVELKDSNRLERVLESALTVAAAALKRGDYVSVLAFSKEVKTFIPPEKGIEHLQTILNELYNLKVDRVESNYQLAFHHIETMLNKRSLLFLFSDVQTFLQNDFLLNQLIRLRQRHLFFMVGLEDEMLIDRAKLRPEAANEAMVKSMAQHQILKKEKEKLAWEQRGLHLVEAEEEELTAVSISYYINLMNQGLL